MYVLVLVPVPRSGKAGLGWRGRECLTINAWQMCLRSKAGERRSGVWSLFVSSFFR
jgi:hypothetical protein